MDIWERGRRDSPPVFVRGEMSMGSFPAVYSPRPPLEARCGSPSVRGGCCGVKVGQSATGPPDCAVLGDLGPQFVQVCGRGNCAESPWNRPSGSLAPAGHRRRSVIGAGASLASAGHWRRRLLGARGLLTGRRKAGQRPAWGPSAVARAHRGAGAADWWRSPLRRRRCRSPCGLDCGPPPSAVRTPVVA